MDTNAHGKRPIPIYIQEHFTNHSRSNQSIRAYCEQTDISPLTFYTWRKRYKTKARDSGTKKAFCIKIIIKIGQLYRIKRLATNKNMTVEQLTALKQKYSK